MSALFTLWTFSAILAALGVGLFIGLAVALFPIMVGARRSASLLTPTRTGIVLALLVAWVGSAFYAGQAIDSYLAADPGLPRVISRWTIWLLFSLAVGIGCWLGLSIRSRRTV